MNHSILAVSLLTVAATANGQETSPPTAAPTSIASDDGEIVVTAQRREQSTRDVGIAIAAYSAETLRALGIQNSTDLARVTPGVFASGSLGGQSQQFSIRGVTQSDFNDAIEAPVAVYIDDVYIPTQQGQNLALFDVERVEVLKGPQGTLFGRNATGGLVQTVVKQPSNMLGGEIRVAYARFDEATIEGALNLPIADGVSIRASGYFNRIDNYWNNVFPAGKVAGSPINFGPAGVSPAGQDEGGSNTLAGRLQIKLEPTDRLTVRLVASGARQRLSTAPYTSVAVIPTLDAQNRVVGVDRAGPTETRIAIGPDGGNFNDPAVLPFAAFAFPGNGTRAPGADWFGYNAIDPKTLDLSTDYARSRLNTTDSYSGAAHVDYDFGEIQLVSVTAYQKYKKNFLMDADGTPTNLFVFATKADTDAWSQELRLSGGDTRLRWTAGAYYLDIDAKTDQGLLGPTGSLLAATFGAAATGIDGVDVIRLKTRSLSVFGQVDWQFAPKLTFVVGGRVIRERQRYDFASYAAANLDDYKIEKSIFLFPLQPSFNDRRARTLWAGKAQLEYRPTSDLLIYAGLNRGIKGGSYNAKLADGSPPLAASQIPYGPETLLNYEGGFKWGNRDFSINASAYYYDYADYQAFLFTNISGFVQNVDAETYGLDVDSSVRIAKGLRLRGAASLQHGTIKNFQIAPGVTRTVRPTYAPRRQASIDASYELPADVAGGLVTFNAQASYASGFFHNIRNFRGDRFGGRTIANFSVRWTSGDTVTITGYVNNAFDKRYGTIGFDTATACGCNQEAFGKPRSYGVSAGYKF